MSTQMNTIISIMCVVFLLMIIVCIIQLVRFEGNRQNNSFDRQHDRQQRLDKQKREFMCKHPELWQ